MKERKKPIDFALPLRHFVGIVFFFVIAVTCIQVISRYVFNRSLIWSEESVRFMVVWMCMVGCAVSNFDDDHMMINIVVEKFPRPPRRHPRAGLCLAAGGYHRSGRSGSHDLAALVL